MQKYERHPLIPLAGGHRPQPRRGVPGAVPRLRGHVRDLPVPDLLRPGCQGILAHQNRRRVPADPVHDRLHRDDHPEPPAEALHHAHHRLRRPRHRRRRRRPAHPGRTHQQLRRLPAAQHDPHGYRHRLGGRRRHGHRPAGRRAPRRRNGPRDEQRQPAGRLSTRGGLHQHHSPRARPASTCTPPRRSPDRGQRDRARVRGRLLVGRRDLPRRRRHLRRPDPARHPHERPRGGRGAGGDGRRAHSRAPVPSRSAEQPPRLRPTSPLRRPPEAGARAGPGPPGLRPRLARGERQHVSAASPFDAAAWRIVAQIAW